MSKDSTVIEKLKEFTAQGGQEVTELAYKSSIGGAGSLFAMNINEIAGLIVAILTGIYMLFQIEAAWVKRKERKKNVQNKNS